MKGKSLLLAIGIINQIKKVKIDEPNIGKRTFIFLSFALKYTNIVTKNKTRFFNKDSAGVIEIISPKHPQFSLSPIKTK